jgi:hypothetical protein
MEPIKLKDISGVEAAPREWIECSRKWWWSGNYRNGARSCVAGGRNLAQHEAGLGMGMIDVEKGSIWDSS